jgi:hypothetical protein
MSDLRSLIEAARADAPSAAARAKVWAGVSGLVGEAATVGAAAGGAATGSLGAAKMLVLGTLLGGSFTVGVGAAVLYVRHPQAKPATSVAASAPATGLLSVSTPAAAPARAGHPDPASDAARDATGPSSLNPAPVAMAAVVPPSRVATLEAGAGKRVALAERANFAGASAQDDTLAREASLLAEARKALVRQDALSALQIVRGLRVLPVRQLVPEELAVEAQALRGLGLDDAANAVEASLRSRYPDSVLGR